jgi:hypothetical protein
MHLSLGLIARKSKSGTEKLQKKRLNWLKSWKISSKGNRKELRKRLLSKLRMPILRRKENLPGKLEQRLARLSLWMKMKPQHLSRLMSL